jgi:hypothetical protein
MKDQVWSVAKILTFLSVGGEMRLTGTGKDVDDVYWVMTPYGEVAIPWSEIKDMDFLDIQQVWRLKMFEALRRSAALSDPDTEDGKKLRAALERLDAIPENYWTFDPDAAWIDPDLSNSSN